MTEESWIDGIQMESYNPPEQDVVVVEDNHNNDPNTNQSKLWQIPAGLVWKSNNCGSPSEEQQQEEEERLNLRTALDPTTSKTIVRWSSIQNKEFLIQHIQTTKEQHSVDPHIKGTIPHGICQIHLGGTTIQLDCTKAGIEVVMDSETLDTSSSSLATTTTTTPYDMILGSDFMKQHQIELDLHQHQIQVSNGKNSIVTIPFIQSRH